MKKLRKSKYVILILLLYLLFSCSKEETQEAQKPLPTFDLTISSEENIDLYVAQLIKSDLAPGISIAVVKDSEVIVRKNYGLANLDNQAPISSDTSFYLASVSKQFTAMAIMILAERNLLSYDDKIVTYLPEIPKGWESITIHHLLTHQSGIPNYAGIPGFSIVKATNSQVLNKLIENENLDFTPGEKYQYSNGGYIVLAQIVERASGQAFSAFVTENIFNPLNMSDSLVYDEFEPAINNRAVGYKYNSDGSYKLRDYNQLTMGPGGIYSTINDLIKWDQALYTEILVSKETLAKAYTSYVPENYGYGWGVSSLNDYPDTNIYLHYGSYDGFKTAISRIPDFGLTIITLSNGEYDWAFDLHYKISEYHLQQ